METQIPIVAFIYDFDGTLAHGNMQEYDFLKEIGIADKSLFWQENSQLSHEQNASEILSYMKLMIDKSNNPENPRPITRNTFTKYGASVPLYKGVKEWFETTKILGEELGLTIEHYINSSGLQEMIEGSPIGKEFKHIFASRVMYDERERAIWPAVAVDFTGKTQYLYMINKGVEQVSNNKEINEHMADDKKRIPFSHMVYFGDGATDIPCMKLLRQQGGYAIAIYDESNTKQVNNAVDLVNRNIVNFACPSDYSKNKDIYNTIKVILRQIKLVDEHNDVVNAFNSLQIDNHKKIKDKVTNLVSKLSIKKDVEPKKPKFSFNLNVFLGRE